MDTGPNWRWSPSYYQRNVFPPEHRHKIEVIPEGIDTKLYERKDEGERMKDEGGGGERVLPDGSVVPAGTRIVTYVSRGFEMTRGFDIFLKAAKLIYQQFPDVLFVVVGSDWVCYGSGEERGGYRSFRDRVLAEGEYDLSQFRFVGRVAEPALAALLAISDLHIYLTVPFITSWSMLDAMSCRCVVLASDQACTREYITHGHNGLLCDFFEVEGIARQAVEVLRDPPAYRHLGEAARRTIERDYSVDVCLPRIKAFFEEVAGKGPRTPSVRAEVLCHPGRGAGVGPASSIVKVEPPQPMELPPYDGTIPFTANVDASTKSPSPLPSPLGTGERGEGGKTVLFCWELGGGLGHLMQMLPLAEDLAARGHRVLVALRHLEGATALFGGAGVTFLQAPCRFAPGPVRHRRPASFAHMLANLGFGDELELFALACAWRNLFKMVGPDLAVFDHSPTPLLAGRGMDFKRALIGSGFCCPPDVAPLPVFRPEIVGKIDPEKLKAFESGILETVNKHLARWGEAPMDRLGQLHGDVDENFLTTFPELDHYPQRAETAAYWGPVIPDADAEAPNWPDAGAKRVFAYLKPFRDLPNVLHALADAGHATLVYAEGVRPGLRRRFESKSLRFADAPVGLARVGEECDAAVLNGGHGVTAEMLLAGKPVVQVPLALEQRLTADATRRLGAGEAVSARSVDAVRSALARVLTDESPASAARRFARRYERFDAKKQRSAMLARAEVLVGGGRKGPEPERGDPAAALRFAAGAA